MGRNFHFEGPRLKVDRANTHIDQLKAEIGAFLARKPYSIVEHHNKAAGKKGLCCHVKELVPTNLAPIIGDAIHNLRSSLDILANDLVGCCTLDFTRRGAYFPIFKDSEGFETSGVKRIQGANSDVIDALRKLQPYVTGDNGLRGLHELDILDKHQLIIPAVAVPSFHNLRPLMRTQTGAVMPVPGMLGTFQIDPTKLGIQELVRFPASVDLVHINQLQHSFSITFRDSDPFPGQDVVDTLELLVKKVIEVIVRFEDED